MNTRQRKVADMSLEEFQSTVRAIVDPSFDNLRSAVTELKDSLARVESSLKVSQSELADVQKQTKIQHFKLANLEQRERARSIRILNLELTKELHRSTAQLSRYLYKHLFLPCLQGAKDQNLLDEIPPLLAVIEYCHPLGQDSTNSDGSSRPAPIICRFNTRLIKYLVVTNKRSVLESFNRSLKNQVRIVDDTTLEIRHTMARVREMQGISSVFFAGQKIKFKTTDNQERVHVVRNPAGTTVEDLKAANPLMAD